jgi:putative transposase
MLFCDDGVEITSQIMDLWAYQNSMQIDFSRPGSATDNARVESFNGTFRAACLDAHWFTSLSEAKQIIRAWRWEDNERRPHRAPGERAPNEFAGQGGASPDPATAQAAENSPCGWSRKRGPHKRKGGTFQELMPAIAWGC